MSLLAELKRRNVIKVSAAYLALGWLVLQLTSIVVPEFGLPAGTMKLVMWIGAIGFPFVVLFSWIYELTPEGLKRENEVDRSQSITHLTSKRLDYIIIGMLAMAIVVTALDRLVPRNETPNGAPEAQAPEDATRQAAASPAAVSAPAAPQAAVAAPDEKSIAVLPFVDMSQTKDQEYFSDGIAEELLNLLAKIPELKVAARTSSFSYKGKDVRIAQIGQELNVAHVLEGSVRKAGNALRITAQLVRAADGYHLWSETFDRPLDDIFAVQDEIAGAVVEQLKITLLGTAPTVRRTDPEAYALYLQAVQQDRQNVHAGLVQAFRLYEQALAIDPSYVPAWHGLASTYAVWAFLDTGPRSSDENFRLAREMERKALAIDADHAPAHAVLGWIALRHDNDLAVAAGHFQHALALDPSSALVLSYVVDMLLGLGRIDTAIDLAEYVAAHDPVNPNAHNIAGDAYYRAGRLDEAIDRSRATLSLSPDSIGAHYSVGVALLLKGEMDAALAEFQAETDEGWRVTGLALVYHALGKKTESDAALVELIEKHERTWSDAISWIHAYRGEADAAFARMEKAVAFRSPGVMNFVTEPLLASLHDDPRWLPFLRKIGKAPEQLAAIKFEVKLPQQ